MPAPSSLACPLPACSPSLITTRFGVPAAIGGKIHTGLDLRAAIGTRVLAPAYGRVTRWIEDAGGGHGMEVEHGGYQTLYFHLSTRIARPWSTVSAGETIARSGASGLVTGPHLHFEVHADGHLVDPEPLLFGGQSSNVAVPPQEGISGYPRDPGQTCPAGYQAGTVNPRILGAVPGLWFNRPTNPDGTVDACIQGGLAPGDNLAAVDMGEAIGVGLGLLIPVAVNVGVVVLVVVLAFAGARQALSAGGA